MTESRPDLEVPTLEERKQIAWEEFERVRDDYLRAPDDFHSAWWYLYHHPAFQEEPLISVFAQCLDVTVVRVNPGTERIEDDSTLNTATRVWLECGEWQSPDALRKHLAGAIAVEEMERLWRGVPSHDIDLDCGAATFEEAIVELARLVHDKYKTTVEAA